MNRTGPEQGSILIAVLWSLFFLTGLALVINVLITPQLTLAATLRDRVVLRYLAEAGIKRSIIEIRADETQEYDALNESWSHNDEAFKEIFLGDGGYFSVEYEAGEDDEEGSEGGQKRYGLIDEERKININAATTNILTGVFEVIGKVPAEEATKLAESIVDWRDADDEPLDNGAENAYYEGLELPYSCKNANFEILEELLLVRGVTQEIFDNIRNDITVYGEGKVNFNTADPLVLQSLGIGADLVEKIMDYREGNDGEESTEDDNVFSSDQSVVSDLSARASLSAEDISELEVVVSAGLIGVRSEYFRGVTFGRFQNRDISIKIDFVISRDETLHFWKEI